MFLFYFLLVSKTTTAHVCFTAPSSHTSSSIKAPWLSAISAYCLHFPFWCYRASWMGRNRGLFGPWTGPVPVRRGETFSSMGKVSIETRLQVVSLSQQGLSQAKIARQTGVSKSAIQALLQKHRKTGTVEDQKRSGRPRKLSGADERHIKLICLQNKKMSSSDITSELALTSGTLVDPSTVRRSLARSGLSRRRGDRSKTCLSDGREDEEEDEEENHKEDGDSLEKELSAKDSGAEITDSDKSIKKESLDASSSSEEA